MENILKIFKNTSCKHVVYPDVCYRYEGAGGYPAPGHAAYPAYPVGCGDEGRAHSQVITVIISLNVEGCHQSNVICFDCIVAIKANHTQPDKPTLLILLGVEMRGELTHRCLQ